MKKLLFLAASFLIAIGSTFATDMGFEAVLGLPSSIDSFSDNSTLKFSHTAIGGAFNIFPEKNIGVKLGFNYLMPKSAKITYEGITLDVTPGESSVLDLTVDYVIFLYNAEKIKINLNVGGNFLFRTYSLVESNSNYKESNYGPEVGLGLSYYITPKVFIKAEYNAGLLFLGSSEKAEKKVWYLAPQISAGFFF